MNDISGKKILLFYPFGATKHYGDSIKDELKKRGADVIGYDERPSQNSIVKIVMRLFKKKMPWIFLVYIKKIIRKNPDTNFDFILILRGEAFSVKAVNILRNEYQKAVIILYLWDILGTTNLKHIIHCFDKALSFDAEDANNNKFLGFRPTFFVPDYNELLKKDNPAFDIVFIGTLHSDRYQIIRVLKAYCDYNHLSYYFYLYVPSFLVFIRNKLLKFQYARLREVHLQPMSLSTTLDFICNSKCILDINYPGQKSLSMRAFEAMASKTKYITTNPEIKKYDFYNPNNVLVIDEKNINIPFEFIHSPFEEISLDIIYKYSVRQFVDDILL
jgi:hypothetical protein